MGGLWLELDLEKESAQTEFFFSWECNSLAGSFVNGTTYNAKVLIWQLEIIREQANCEILQT